ncbi:MAG: hypothetical protein SGI87_03140 [Flavobacteriales bacterium]|nr:hypothetical protein [Flavobacteriales bacterium]
MHEVVNAVKEAIVGQWSETEVEYYRYINPNQAIENCTLILPMNAVFYRLDL